MVLLANWPVPLLTMGVVPTQELLVVPVIVTVEAELEAVVVLLYKFHCIDPEPAPGAGNTVAAILIFTLKNGYYFKVAVFLSLLLSWQRKAEVISECSRSR
jgi:hypothetical protein